VSRYLRCINKSDKLRKIPYMGHVSNIDQYVAATSVLIKL
jgi:hypothetical protein